MVGTRATSLIIFTEKTLCSIELAILSRLFGTTELTNSYTKGKKVVNVKWVGSKHYKLSKTLRIIYRAGQFKSVIWYNSHSPIGHMHII